MKKIDMAYLEKLEPKSIQAALAMMAFNPSIGRTLPKRSVDKFLNSVLREMPKLKKVRTRNEFDHFHDRWCIKLRKEIGRRCGYGSAQKAINVFLKMFVYWSKVPGNSKKLIPLLHVPLDSVVMGHLNEYHWPEVEKLVEPYYQNCEHDYYNLKYMTREQYLAWQKLLRKIAGKHPPIRIDVIWQLDRLKRADRS